MSAQAGRLDALINAYVEAQRVHLEAIRADNAQDAAAQGENDTLTAICAYRPASDFERSWRGEFLKNIFAQQGGKEPTAEQMAAMIDAATPQPA